MAVINIGSAAIDRASAASANTTYVDETAGTAADGTGTIDTVTVFMETAHTNGLAEVGIFYRTTGTSLTTRSNASLGSLAAGLNTITGLSLAVQAGDWIGIYFPTSGSIRRATAGGTTQLKAGDNIPCTNVDFGATQGRIYSVHGTGTTTVTTSIKSVNTVLQASIKSINGVAIASVKSVNGVSNV